MLKKSVEKESVNNDQSSMTYNNYILKFIINITLMMTNIMVLSLSEI